MADKCGRPRETVAVSVSAKVADAEYLPVDRAACALTNGHLIAESVRMIERVAKCSRWDNVETVAQGVEGLIRLNCW